MQVLADRWQRPARAAAPSGHSRRPVVLATLSVRMDPDAERMALDDIGAKLIVANMLALPAYPMTLTLAPAT